MATERGKALRGCLVDDAQRATQQRKILRRDVFGVVYEDASACAADVARETGQAVLAARYNGSVVVYVFPRGALPRGRVYTAAHAVTEEELRSHIDNALTKHPCDRSVLVDTTLSIYDRFPLPEGTDITTWYDPHGKKDVLISQHLMDTDVLLLCHRTRE